MPARKRAVVTPYDVVIHMRVEVNPGGMIVDTVDSVTAAVRHNVKLCLPNNWTNSGLRYDHGFTDVTVAPILKEEVTS